MVYEKNGWFYMRFQLAGIRYHKACRTRSYQTAVKRERQARLEASEALARDDRGMTLSTAIERAFAERWVHNKDSSTVYGRLRKTLAVLGDLPVGDIDNAQFQKLARHLLAEGRATATVNRYWSALSTLLKMAQREWQVIDTVPYVKKHREPPGRLRVVTSSEEKSLLELADPAMRDLIVLLVDTGCRLSEILDGPSVDLDNNLLTIWEQKGGGRNESRSIPMTSRVREVVERGLPAIGIHDAERRWQDLRRRMGLEEDGQFVMHALRHTCASRLVQRGVDLYVVKDLLGHSSITVTERYAHLNPARLKQAMSVLEPVGD